MASIRIPSLRHLAASSIRPPRTLTQRRWAQVHDVRFLATTRPSQAVVDKYRDKLDQKVQQEGLGSIDELKAAYKDKIDEQRKKDSIDHGPLPHIPQAPETPVQQPNRGPLPGLENVKREEPAIKSPRQDPAPPAGGKDKQGVKTLGDIIDLQKAKEIPDEDLAAAWRLHHASSPQLLCAMIPASTYRAMEGLAQTATPFFVLPVPSETEGAEMHLLQWTFDRDSRTSTVLFTQLAEYKMRGEFAQPHTTVTHHLDLADDRGLVLMQGQVMEGRGIKPEQARWLVMCLQRFYGGWEGAESAGMEGQRKQRADERRKLLEWFGSGDPRFTVEKLMEEAERMG